MIKNKTTFFLITALFIFATSKSQIHFEKKLGTQFEDKPTPIINTIDQTYILGVNTTASMFKSLKFSTLYELSEDGTVIREKILMKTDTSLNIAYLTTTYQNNIYMGTGSLRYNNKHWLWLFTFDYQFNILHEARYELPESTIMNKAIVVKKNFNYYIAIEYKTNVQPPYQFLLKYNPNDDTFEESDWIFHNGYMNDFVKNIHNDNFLMSGMGIERSFARIWEISPDMELLTHYNDLEHDLYHMNDLKWVNENTLIHAGSFYDSQFDETRFMGIQIFDSAMTVQHFNSFGEIGVRNYVGAYNSIAVNSANKIYLAGTQNVVYNPYPDLNNYIPVHKLDTALTEEWSYLAGGDAYYTTRSISTSFDGGCIIAATRYDEALQNQENDVYLIAMGPDGLDTSIDDPENDDNVVLYPNPGNDMITIDSKEHHFSFNLFKNTGQVVLTKENQKTINTSTLNSGIYFYRITQNGEVLNSGKWVKKGGL